MLSAPITSVRIDELRFRVEYQSSAESAYYFWAKKAQDETSTGSEDWVSSVMERFSGCVGRSAQGLEAEKLHPQRHIQALFLPLASLILAEKQLTRLSWFTSHLSLT